MHAIFLSGGVGSRLWPISRSKHPKQFLDVLNSGSTMFQETVNRLEDIDISSMVTVCNEDHRFFVAEQLESIDKNSSIIIEPEGRNTAPAIALAALLAEGDPIMLVLPADHVIVDKKLFSKIINESIQLADKEHLITFGIQTTSPHTDYGYIKKGLKSSNGFHIEKFIEKPDLDIATTLHNSDDYFWNSGMFMFKASTYLDELKKFRPDIYEACVKSIENTSKDNIFLNIDAKEFSKCASESIDYAVMEQTKKGIVVPMDVGWNDIGSWSSLWDLAIKDDNSNTFFGNVLSFDSTNSLVQNNHNQLLATVGIDNLIISITDNAILIADKSKSKEVKSVVLELEKNNMEESRLHRKVYRPWGSYDSIDSDDGFQVKRLTVKPKQKLSVQKHYHRSEHWVVVSGTALVHYGNKSHELNVNESTYHDKEVVHALENPGNKPLVLIEVQIGDYLGEDDIVRYEDIYGRKD